jgi:hypothetical protein
MPHDPISREQLEEQVRMGTDLYNRLHFLHWAIDDTQNTIRFLDTKAAFCVTLVSGMVAVALEHPLTSHVARYILFPIFITVVACSVMVCLRVIFPTIIPHGAGSAPALPRFFIGHNKAHTWIKTTLRNPRRNILSETHESHRETLHASDDIALLDSMSQTLVVLSFIRQVKSDRLHAAMYCLALAVLLFGAIMLVQL